MTTVGPIAPTVAASVAATGGTVAWTTPSNAIAQDGVGSGAVGLGGGSASQNLTLTGFGFQLPSNALVRGISVTIRHKQSTTNQVQDRIVQLTVGGVLRGDNFAAAGVAWSQASFSTAAYGGATNPWNAGLTYADVNSSSFGVVISATNTATSTSTALVDAVTVTVDYIAGVAGDLTIRSTALKALARIGVSDVGSQTPSSVSVTSVDAQAYARYTILDNANATTFLGGLLPGDGSLIAAFIEAASSTRYAISYYRCASPTAATPTWALYRREAFDAPGATLAAATLTDAQRSAYFPQAHAVGADGRWLRRVNREDLTGGTPGTGVLQYLIGSNKADGGGLSWTDASGTDFTFGTNSATTTVQVSRILTRSDGRKMYFGEQWPYAAGTRVNQPIKIKGQRPYVAIDTNGNGTGLTACLTTTPSGSNLFYPNEPSAVELANGDWLMIWRSGTIPWKDDSTGTDTSAASRSSQYTQVLLKKTVGANTYTFQTPKKAPFSTATTPIHPELIKDPGSGAIIFASQAPEGAWYTLDEGATWTKLNFKLPAATYASGYYPQMRAIGSNMIAVLSHRGADEPYGQSDTAILMDRFTVVPAVVVSTNTLHVSADNGSDTSTTGSITQPFKTIEGALAKQATIVGAGKATTIYLHASPQNVAAGNRWTYPNVDLTGFRFSNWVTIKPYPGDSVIVGPVRANNCSYIRFANDNPAGNGNLRIRAWGTDLPAVANSSLFAHAFWIVGAADHVDLSGALIEGTDTENALWIGADVGMHDFMFEKCVIRNNTVIQTTGAPSCIAKASRAYNVWIRGNLIQNCLGMDAIQISNSSTSPSVRHRNIWIEDNVIDGVYDGPSPDPHSDGLQVIGYSGPLSRGNPTEDVTGERPTGDVGVVIRRNEFKRCRGILCQANGVISGSGSAPGPGEHDSLIITDNLSHDPRGAGSTTDTPKLDFNLRLPGNCPYARIVNNTFLLYPIGSTAGNTSGMDIRYITGAPAATDEGSHDLIVANNITDMLAISGPVTFAYHGQNTYRLSDTYPNGTGDLQGVPTFTNAAAGDFTLTTTNPTVLNNANATYAPRVDFRKQPRSLTTPDRGAIELVSGGTATGLIGKALTSRATILRSTISGGASVKSVVAKRLIARALVDTGTRIGLVQVPQPGRQQQELTIDPPDTPLVLLDAKTPFTGFGLVLTRHDFGSSAFTRITASSVETEGDLTVAVHNDNRTITLGFYARADTHDNLQGILRGVDSKVAKLGRAGGTIRWRVPTGDAITFDIVGVESYVVSLDEEPGLYYEGLTVPIQLVLTARPFGTGLQRSISTTSQSADAYHTVRIPPLLGDVPAFSTISISAPASSTPFGSVTWGLEARSYDPSTNPPVIYRCADGILYSGTIVLDATAYQGRYVSRTLATPKTSYAFVDQRENGSQYLANAGKFRVFARARSTSNTTALQLQWWPSYTGNVAQSELNSWARLQTANTWELLDLGMIDARSSYADGWAARLNARSDAPGATIDANYIFLVPVDEGYGQFRNASFIAMTYNVASDVALAGDSTGRVFFPDVYIGDYVKFPAGIEARLVVKPADADFVARFADQRIAYPVTVQLSYAPRYLTIPGDETP